MKKSKIVQRVESILKLTNNRKNYVDSRKVGIRIKFTGSNSLFEDQKAKLLKVV